MSGENKRQPILPESDEINIQQEGQDILVQINPAEADDAALDYGIPAEIYSGIFTRQFNGGVDDLDLGEGLDEKERNEDDIANFIVGQDELYIIGQTLEVVRSDLVMRIIKDQMREEGYRRLNFVIANPQVDSVDGSMSPELKSSFSELKKLSDLAKKLGQEMNVWVISEEFPLDFIMVGGREEDSLPLRVRLQNETGRRHKASDGLSEQGVRYLEDYVPGDVAVVHKIFSELSVIFEKSQRIEF